MKKYIFLMRTSGIGGAEISTMRAFRSIDYTKYSIIFAVVKNVFSDYFDKYKLPINVVSISEIRNLRSPLKRLLKYYIFFKATKADVVVFHQFWLSSFFLPEIIAAYIATKGSVYMIVHDSAPPFEKYESKNFFGFLQGIGIGWRLMRISQRLMVYFTKNTIAISKFVRKNLIKDHGYPEAKVKLAYNSIEVKDFSPSIKHRAKVRQALDICFSSNVIISTARLDKVKRLDRLIMAFNMLHNDIKDIRLLLVGDGAQAKDLKSMVSALDQTVRDKIKFLGFKKDVRPFLQASDIYVLPSDSEGFGNATLEAMACGAVAIITNYEGSSEIVRDGFNGLIVDRSAQGVLSGLRKIMSLSNEKRQNIVSNARKFVSDNFDSKLLVPKMLNLIGINAE